jgi:hypothetical protein
MIRISWLHPDIVARAREALMRGRSSWSEAFAAALAGDEVLTGEPPEGVAHAAWPQLAEHVARAERVRECIATEGLARARERFAGSKYAVERAVLLEAPDQHEVLDEADAVLGMLACEIDEHLAYGHFLSRLVELRAGDDPGGTVTAYERFIEAARRVPSTDPSWQERMLGAEVGLAQLYVRVGRSADAESLFARGFALDAADVTVPISAARAFLEGGDVARAVSWLERGSVRAKAIGRDDLAGTLDKKVASLRGRMS